MEDTVSSRQMKESCTGSFLQIKDLKKNYGNDSMMENGRDTSE